MCFWVSAVRIADARVHRPFVASIALRGPTIIKRFSKSDRDVSIRPGEAGNSAETAAMGVRAHLLPPRKYDVWQVNRALMEIMGLAV